MQKNFGRKINKNVGSLQEIFDDDWRVDTDRPIKYEISQENTEDILVPMYKSYDSPRLRTNNKNVYLSELCRFNNLNETDIINHFKFCKEKFIE